jgi:hypothetical protein
LPGQFRQPRRHANLEQHKAGLVKMRGAAFPPFPAIGPKGHGGHILAAAALLLAAGCASLDSDLQSAEAKCAPTSAITVFVTCLNTMDGPIWQKESPENEPAYKDFAAARLGLAENLDSGKITPTQFSEGTAKARAKFSALLIQNARARQQEVERQRTEQEMNSMERPTSAPSDMGNGMDKGMGMGM